MATREKNTQRRKHHSQKRFSEKGKLGANGSHGRPSIGCRKRSHRELMLLTNHRGLGTGWNGNQEDENKKGSGSFKSVSNWMSKRNKEKAGGGFV